MAGYRRLAALVIALIAVAGISTAAQARPAVDPIRDATGLDPGQELTGLAASVLTRPSAVRATDGRYHLAYELVLTGTTALDLDVERVDVRDAKTHRVLLSLAGPELLARMNAVGDAPPGVPPDRPAVEPSATLLTSSSSAVVWLDVVVQRRADVPAALEHLVVSSARPEAGGASFEVASLVGRVAVQAREPLVLGPPVGSGLWVAAEGCCDDPTHHRRGLLAVDGNLVVPQRFAIDWIKLDESHRTWVGDPHQLSSYFSYGEPLLAAAAGTVVVAVDGNPDAPPPDDPPPPPFAGLPGNHVTLRIGPGLYLLYAHMKPGSVRVRVGDRVRRGQVLGLLGNSGASATPHLHLQLQIGRSFVSDGPPFVFDRFQFLGKITDTFWDGDLGLRANGQMTFVASSDAGPPRRDMPLSRDVVQFSAP